MSAADSSGPLSVEPERYIEFTPPCIELEFDGELRRFGTFSSNEKTMDVTLRNPIRFRGIKLADQSRLKKVVLEYRKESGRSPLWNRALNINGEELDFLEATEDAFGYIKVPWKLPTLTASYEIRLISECIEEPGAPPHLNHFISESIVG